MPRKVVRPATKEQPGAKRRPAATSKRRGGPQIDALLRELDSLWTLDSTAKFAFMDRIRAVLGDLGPAVEAELITAADDLTYRIEGFALDQKRAMHRTAVEALRSALGAI